MKQHYAQRIQTKQRNHHTTTSEMNEKFLPNMRIHVVFLRMYRYFGPKFEMPRHGKEITFRLLSKKSEHFQRNFRTGIQNCVA